MALWVHISTGGLLAHVGVVALVAAGALGMLFHNFLFIFFLVSAVALAVIWRVLRAKSADRSIR